MRALIVAAMGTAACYGPSYRDCEVTCTAAIGCPDNLTCVAGRCRVAGAGSACTTMPGEAGVDSVGDGSGPDGGYPTGPFGAATLVQLSGFTAVEDPSLTADLLQLFFVANGDIFHAQRPQPMGPWASVRVLNELASIRIDRDPDISPDGTTLMFSSDRTGNFELYESKFNAAATTWETPELVPGLQGPPIDAAPSRADEMYLAFESDNAAAGAIDLFMSSRPAQSVPWESRKPLSELNTAAQEGGPSLAPDRVTIYFHSNAGGDFDLYVARRSDPADPSSPFGIPTRLGELATTGLELDPWVSPDGHYIMFVRVLGGNVQLLEATR